MRVLNSKQFEAVHEPGSVAITAGAGTGKTHVLAERYFRLIELNDLSPLNVVAVTFTDKAADELRSRIRRTIAKKASSPVMEAEVDAAQISTIHSLAARICRDFYDIADIPSDFRLMDANESTLWTLGRIEEAIGEVCEAEAIALGYSFLIEALYELLADPYKAEKALSNCNAEHWRSIIENSKNSAQYNFENYLKNAECVKRLRELAGPADDKMELQRNAILISIGRVIAGETTSVYDLDEVSLRLGSKNKWPEDEYAEVKLILTDLREKARGLIRILNLEFGALDEELIKDAAELRSAFIKALKYLTDAKIADRLLDYNDLEINALKILDEPEVLDHYRERWKAFLIDEVQDINPIQAAMLTRLTDGGNLTVVGDEKQSIYGFRGADSRVFGNIQQRIKDSGGKLIKLEQTYRANSALASVMNRIFEPMLRPNNQDLFSERAYEGQGEIAHISFAYVNNDENDKNSRLNVEARHIARTVREMVDGSVLIFDKEHDVHRPVEYGDFAVLSRTWAPLEIYADAFSAVNIPAVNAGGGSLIKTREFKDAAALLTFLADQNDDLSLTAVLRSPFFGVSDLALYRLSLAVESDSSWWSVLGSAVGLDPFLLNARNLLKELLNVRPRHSAEGLLRLAARETGFAAVIANLPHGQRREADWNGTLQFVRGLQQNGWEDLFSVVRYTRLAITHELDIERPFVESDNAVSLMTVHAAKGLEWPIVFIPDLTRQFKGGRGTLMIDADIGVGRAGEDDDGEKIEPAIYELMKLLRQEREVAERGRLLYVAITRGADLVRLSATDNRGAALDLLRPGLESAAIPQFAIEYLPEETLPPAPGEPMAFPDISFDTGPINISPKSVMATGLSAYASCPQRYKFQFVDGHPGLGEGSRSGASVGTAAHLALENDIDSVELLARHSNFFDDEIIRKGLDLARNFRVSPIFADVRVQTAERELRFSSTVGGINVYGIADLVGDDFVLDYKTDAIMDPEKHSLQLWAYARALGKPRAFIAYLRHNVLHEITAEDLARFDRIGTELIERLKAGDFSAKPSPETCGRCNFNPICSSRSCP